MRLSDFVEGGVSTGTMQPVSQGLHAFIPNPLPPNWEMPNEFWPLLRDAWATIRELNGIGHVLPDPSILLKPIEDREAIQSSRIEGTFATARELLLFEIQPHSSSSSSESPEKNTWREVWNYRQALMHGVKSDLPLSKRLIRELHSVLLTDVRGEDTSPGEFRKLQVGIRGDRANPQFVPPPPLSVDACLNDLERYIQSPGDNIDPLIQCFLVHYQFESIHPFRDGNGRVGRLLLAIMIMQKCDLTHPWLFVSQYFEAHKDQYFDLLYNVSRVGDWSGWVKFCLEATVWQAKDTLERCKRLLKAKDDLKGRLATVKGSNKLIPIVDLALEKMLINVNDAATKFGITYPTALKQLESLVKIGVLRALTDFAPKTFYAPDLFSITYRDLGGFDD